MTAMTLQGDADGTLDCGACGVRAGGTGLYAEGMHHPVLPAIFYFSLRYTQQIALNTPNFSIYFLYQGGATCPHVAG